MLLISLRSGQQAQWFVDYMTLHNIMIRLEYHNQQGIVSLFLDDETQLEYVKKELADFLLNPYDKRYQDAAWQLANEGNKPIAGSLFNKWSFNKKTLNLVSVGPITGVVTISCIVVFIWLLFSGSFSVLSYLGFPISDHEYWQAWRFFTPVIIHFSLMHIVFNLTWWWYLGGMVERYLGSKKLIEILLLAGVLSNYAQAIIESPYFGGLSGVVYALMGYVWLFGELNKPNAVHFERTMLILALVWLVAGFMGLLGPIANVGHLSGFVVGIILALKDSYLVKRSS